MTDSHTTPPAHPTPVAVKTDIRPATARWQRLRRGRIFAYLAIAAPGLIAANAGNDAAGIATYSSAGSQSVYRTLFFMVLVTVALILVQEMSVGWAPTRARAWPR